MFVNIFGKMGWQVLEKWRIYDEEFTGKKLTYEGKGVSRISLYILRAGRMWKNKHDKKTYAIFTIQEHKTGSDKTANRGSTAVTNL